MSQRFNIDNNINDSKNTRLPIAEDFAVCRYNRDELAHISRYLFVCETIIDIAKKLGRPVSILDIGCGEIYIARTINASFVIKKEDIISIYVGLDIDYKSLDLAKKKLPHSFNIEILQGDTTTNGLTKFNANGFDIVICLETIEHIQPQFVLPLLIDINRITKHFAIFSTPNFDAGSGSIPEDHIKEWGYDELNVEIKKSGLQVIRECGVFSNLNLVKKIAKQNMLVKTVYQLIEKQTDSNFLSLFMSKIVGAKHSQNVLRIAKPGVAQ